MSTKNEIENCLIVITQSIKTMNHSSERIAASLETMVQHNASNFGKVHAEHLGMVAELTRSNKINEKRNDNTFKLLKYTIGALVVVVTGLKLTGFI